MIQNLKLLSPASSTLNEKARAIEVNQISSDEIQSIINRMFEIAAGEQGSKNKRTMVGLAAPQIGVLKRIILVGINAQGKGERPELRAYINPVIVERSSDSEEGREGCYSTGKICGIVSRSKTLTIEAYNQASEKIQEIHQGFPARIFQHEIDHLDGIRFPDRITDDTKLHWVEADKFGEYREKWNQWEVLCPRKKWEQLKSGQAL